MGANLESNKKVKIHFIIQKQVDFGKALYVVGNIGHLGGWSIQKSLKLSWSKDHYWTGFISLSTNQIDLPIQFKYAIGNWEHPQSGALQWEAGKNNRVISGPIDTHHILCENTWNMEKITLNLIVPEQEKNVEYGVIGDCKELGSWKKSFKMKRNEKKFLPLLQNLKLNNEEKKYTVYSLSFKIFRGKPKIHYYYIKKAEGTEMERHPGRKYQIEQRQHSHPKCLKIDHKRGDTEMYEICNFKELNYSKITENILLGAYLRTSDDFKLLKKEDVSSILSIQTSSDIAMHCLTESYLRQQAQIHGIKLETYAIEDMNKKDFLQKFMGAIQLLKKMIDQKKKVYVHCSAGVYRSPQLVVLYLVLAQNYSPQQAVEFVKLRHPFARPNRKIVLHALQLLNHSTNKKEA